MHANMESEVEVKKPSPTVAPPRLATVPVTDDQRPSRTYGLRFEEPAQRPQPAAAASPAPPTSPSRTVMDVVTPKPAPPADGDSPPIASLPSAEKTTPHPSKKQPKPPKPAKVPRVAGNGVGLAIFATVVIVLGLAAMAVYAYIKTQK